MEEILDFIFLSSPDRLEDFSKHAEKDIEQHRLYKLIQQKISITKKMSRF